ncbi:UNVERIFIED_CONTAM: hypothetical protein Scaly_1543500 [Sesamum calycinum]|uniref:Uncharacterized protein n=1 Tax=Sesamum calycinum TaxID=2727403 RepID=A0AAW2P972_9LAMI
MSETRDEVSVRIDNILLALPSSRCKPSIFRVNDDIRHTNGKLYDPKVISIGPFHHGKDHLRDMEQHKFRYLKLLLKRRNESSVDKYVMAMRSLEGKARKCYAGPVEFSPDDFVQMLLLDGCFIIELIRKYGIDELRESDDIVFQYEQVLSQLRHDLMLVENQVPFFVVDQLFNMTRTGNPDDHILFLIQLFIGLSVSDETESIFRNIMAYEHFFIDNQSKHVTDYAFFLHCLINSSKDVEVLRRHGILTNLLGDDEMVYHMFNR